MRPSPAPKRYALMMALTYFALTSLYITVSTAWVADQSHGSIELFKHYQQIKGCAFMLVTAVAFYFSIRWVSKKAALSEHELLETQERWLDAERNAAPALLASVIAHDVANLLTILRLNVEKIKLVPSLPTPANEAIAKFDQGTDRLTDLVKRLRGASSSLFNEAPMSFDFTKTVSETLSLMQSHACCESVNIDLVGDSAVFVLSYPVLVHQLAMNLLINAAEASGPKGRVRFTVNGPSKDQSSGVTLICEDDGPGIEPSLREKVMGAFFTTKATGTGLGLSSVRSCVEIHRGSMKIDDSDELGGARFTIHLPDLTVTPVANQGHWYAVPEADVPMAPVDSMRT